MWCGGLTTSTIPSTSSGLPIYSISGATTSSITMVSGSSAVSMIISIINAYPVNSVYAAFYSSSLLAESKLISGSGSVVNVSPIASSLISGATYIKVTVHTQQISETRTFLVDDSSNRFEKQRVMWLNQFGGFDYWNFQAKVDESTTINTKTFETPLPYNYTTNDRMENVYSVESNKNYVLNTGIVDRTTANWLKDLFKSSLVYFIDDSGNLRPVTILETTYPKYIKGRDSVFNYNITFRDAIKNKGNN